MARRWRKRLLIAAVVLPLLVWGSDRILLIHWAGWTDLGVAFVITDDATGASLPGARVEIRQRRSGFYEDREEREFALVGDGAGLARWDCRGSLCFGTLSGLGFTDTFTVHLPSWRFRVVADGYEPSEWTELDVPEYIRQARRAGPGRAELAVPVSLRRKPAEPATAPDPASKAGPGR